MLITKEDIDQLKDQFRLLCSKQGISANHNMYYFREEIERKIEDFKNTEEAYEKIVYLIELIQLRNSKKPSKGIPISLPEGMETKPEEEQMPEELIKRAKELAHSPNLLYKINKILGLNIVGEEKTRLLIFVLALSCKTQYKQIVIIKAESSSGKNYLTDNVVGKYFPARKRGRFTKHAMEYSDINPDEILYLQQLMYDETTDSMRLISTSDGGFILEHYAKDEQGNPTTEVRTIAAITLFSTTTYLTLDREFSTRIWELNVDESEEQTKRILEFQDKQERRTLEEIMGKTEHPEQETLTTLIKRFPKIDEVIIPFDLKEYFPTKTVRIRRDFRKFKELVKLIAYLHHFQRPKTVLNGKRIVIAMPQDAYYAIQMGKDVLEATLTGTEKRLREALGVITPLPDDETITTSLLATLMKISQPYARYLLNALVKRGYLMKQKNGRENNYSRSMTFNDTIKTGIKTLDYVKLKKQSENFLDQYDKTISRKERTYIAYHPITGELVELF